MFFGVILVLHAPLRRDAWSDGSCKSAMFAVFRVAAPAPISSVYMGALPHDRQPLDRQVGLD
ncbi:hypothetical protein, partial [Sphingomonas sp.]|uniref:hypothetical protein n=1 Tax=Sphingomonas sp. TaxID=28214 RepID=UPI0035C8208F